ncbi:MAG: baseplate J/gp47 family protein [Polyangiales bacterium]
MYSIADLLTPESADDALDVLLSDLAEQGFATTAWDDFEPIVGLLRADARALSDLLRLVSIVARAGLIELSPGNEPDSPGDWLSLLAQNYGITRFQPRHAVLRARVRLSPTASPYTIAPGGLTIEHVSGTLRFRYTSAATTPVTIAPGAFDVLEFAATEPGRAFNRKLADFVAPIQSLPGVSIVLEDSAPPAGSPMVTLGADTESDASVRARIRAQWDTIGLQKTTDAIEFLARNAPFVQTPITRVSIDASNPRGPGTVNVYLATDAGPANPADVVHVSDHLAPRAAIGSSIEAFAAAPRAIGIRCIVRAPGAVVSTVSAGLQRAIDAIILDVPLGGTLVLSQLVDALQDESLGVQSVELNSIGLVGGALLRDDYPIGTINSVAVPAVHQITVLG